MEIHCPFKEKTQLDINHVIGIVYLAVTCNGVSRPADQQVSTVNMQRYDMIWMFTNS